MNEQKDYFKQADLAELNTSKLTGLKNILIQIQDKFGHFTCTTLLYKQSIKPYINRILQKKNPVRTKIKLYLLDNINLKGATDRIIHLINLELKKHRNIDKEILDIQDNIQDKVNNIPIVNTTDKLSEIYFSKGSFLNLFKDAETTVISTDDVDFKQKMIDKANDEHQFNMSIKPRDLFVQKDLSELSWADLCLLETQIFNQNSLHTSIENLIEVIKEHHKDSECKTKLINYITKHGTWCYGRLIHLIDLEKKMRQRYNDNVIKFNNLTTNMYSNTAQKIAEVALIGHDLIPIKEPINQKLYKQPKDYFIQSDLDILSKPFLIGLKAQIEFNNNIDDLINVINSTGYDFGFRNKIVSYLDNHKYSAKNRIAYLIKLQLNKLTENDTKQYKSMMDFNIKLL